MINFLKIAENVKLHIVFIFLCAIIATSTKTKIMINLRKHLMGVEFQWIS